MELVLLDMDFKKQFPALRDGTYLNTASSGILSEAIQKWRQSHDNQFLAQGSSFRIQQADFLHEVRQAVARFFGGSIRNTFLTQNFSVAFNTFLDGLSSSHRFLLIKSDYPSVNYPVECRGFKCEYVDLNEHLEQNILEKIVSFKPTVLAVSIVQYITGIKINPVFLKELKEKYPDLLIVVDGTQFCGTGDFNFEESGMDVLISSGYKWMLAGYGNGFILLKDHVHPYLYQNRSIYSLPKEPFLKDRELLSLCFEPGHLDTLNFGTLHQSILYLEGLGPDFIQQKINSLAKLAKIAFMERGLLPKDVTERNTHSSIFNLLVNAETIERIAAAKIIALPRGAGLRVAFHFYNDEQDLMALLKVIDR